MNAHIRNFRNVVKTNNDSAQELILKYVVIIKNYKHTLETVAFNKISRFGLCSAGTKYPLTELHLWPSLIFI